MDGDTERLFRVTEDCLPEGLESVAEIRSFAGIDEQCRAVIVHPRNGFRVLRDRESVGAIVADTSSTDEIDSSSTSVVEFWTGVPKNAERRALKIAAETARDVATESALKSVQSDVPIPDDLASSAWPSWSHVHAHATNLFWRDVAKAVMDVDSRNHSDERNKREKRASAVTDDPRDAIADIFETAVETAMRRESMVGQFVFDPLTVKSEFSVESRESTRTEGASTIVGANREPADNSDQSTRGVDDPRTVDMLEYHRYHGIEALETSLSEAVKIWQRDGRLVSISVDQFTEDVLQSLITHLRRIVVVDDETSLDQVVSVSRRKARLLIRGLTIQVTDPNQIYYDAIAQDYNEIYTDGISQAEDSIVADELATLIDEDDVVLDLGCGAGLGLELIDRNYSRFKYIGIDISPNMIKKARDKHGDSPHVEFEVIDMTDLSIFPADHFDCVISLWGSFSHGLPASAAIEELDRVLKPGGCFFLMVYSRWSFGNFLSSLRNCSIKPIERVRPYQIRQKSGQLTALARFYSTRELARRFARFTDVSVGGINAFVEQWPLSWHFRKGYRTKRSKRALRIESKFLRKIGANNLAHSLFVRGKQQSAAGE